HPLAETAGRLQWRAARRVGGGGENDDRQQTPLTRLRCDEEHDACVVSERGRLDGLAAGGRWLSSVVHRSPPGRHRCLLAFWIWGQLGYGLCGKVVLGGYDFTT